VKVGFAIRILLRVTKGDKYFMLFRLREKSILFSPLEGAVRTKIYGESK